MTPMKLKRRTLTFERDGLRTEVHIRIARSRRWFGSAESRDPRWLVAMLAPGLVLAVRVRNDRA